MYSSDKNYNIVISRRDDFAIISEWFDENYVYAIHINIKKLFLDFSFENTIIKNVKTLPRKRFLG